MLALDEILAGLLALLVALDHEQLFRHVKRDEIVFAFAAPVFFYRGRKVLILDKSEVINAILDPVTELGLDTQEHMQVARIDSVRGCRGRIDSPKPGDQIFGSRRIFPKYGENCLPLHRRKSSARLAARRRASDSVPAWFPRNCSALAIVAVVGSPKSGIPSAGLETISS